jgi:hypothetical protein
MDIFPLVNTLPQVASSIAADDYTVTMLGLLVGSVAGSVICGYMQQARAKRAEIERRINPFKRTTRR